MKNQAAQSATDDGSDDPINGFFAGGSRHPADLTRSNSGSAKARHAAELALFQRRTHDRKQAQPKISAAPIKSRREPKVDNGPTPERLAKPDIGTCRTFGGLHRSIPTIQRLFDQDKLDPCRRTAHGMLRSAERLQRHYECSHALKIKAQDLTGTSGGSSSDDPIGQEAWVEHGKQVILAKKMMGWSEAYPNRGPACIVMAVICEEMSVTEAADLYLVPARKEAMLAAAMDRLREGLFALACHYKEI